MSCYTNITSTPTQRMKLYKENFLKLSIMICPIFSWKLQSVSLIQLTFAHFYPGPQKTIFIYFFAYRYMRYLNGGDVPHWPWLFGYLLLPSSIFNQCQSLLKLGIRFSLMSRCTLYIFIENELCMCKMKT